MKFKKRKTKEKQKKNEGKTYAKNSAFHSKMLGGNARLGMRWQTNFGDCSLHFPNSLFKLNSLIAAASFSIIFRLFFLGFIVLCFCFLSFWLFASLDNNAHSNGGYDFPSAELAQCWPVRRCCLGGGSGLGKRQRIRREQSMGQVNSFHFSFDFWFVNVLERGWGRTVVVIEENPIPRRAKPGEMDVMEMPEREIWNEQRH